MYLSTVVELDKALTDCWRRLSDSRRTRNARASALYVAQLDRLLDMRLRLTDQTAALVWS